MKFFPQLRDNDCALAALEFLFQKDRSTFEKSLVYVEGGLVSFPMTVEKFTKIQFQKKLTKNRNKILICQWPDSGNTTHALCQRGRKIYEPFFKKTYKSIGSFCRKNGMPKIVATVTLK